ncbi:MAG: DNA-protecting protein DprA [Actinomycetota bacterium]
MSATGEPPVHLLALASLPHMGPARLDALVAGRDPAWVWAELLRGGHRLDRLVVERCGARWPAVREAWVHRARTLDLDDIRRRHRDVAVWRRGDPDFPERLVDDPEPPALLLATGPLPVGPSVAIVGTRRCSGYGRDVATELGRGLAAVGVVVASGLALGIDAAAHRGALEGGAAPPLAVVATGLDVVYPGRNRSLWSQIADRGAIASEAPMGTPAARWRFPARNRILAGLADAVVVVESHASGGSMHTVSAALERDIPVLAVPGPITSPASAGTNALLADGATPARHVDDVLTALGLRQIGPAPETPALRPPPAELRPIVAALDATPTSVDVLAARTGVDVVSLHGALHRLAELRLAADEGGWWRSVGAVGVGRGAERS